LRCTILFFSLSSAFERKLSRYENRIQKEIGLLETSLQSLSDTRKKIDEALALHTKELNELKKLLTLHIDSSGGYFEYTGRELKKLQEKIESLDNNLFFNLLCPAALLRGGKKPGATNPGNTTRLHAGH